MRHSSWSRRAMTSRVWNLSNLSRSTSRPSTASILEYARISAGHRAARTSREPSTEDTSSSWVELPRTPSPVPLLPRSPSSMCWSISTSAADTVGCLTSSGRDRSSVAHCTRTPTGSPAPLPLPPEPAALGLDGPAVLGLLLPPSKSSSAFPMRRTKHTHSAIHVTLASGSNPNASRASSSGRRASLSNQAACSSAKREASPASSGSRSAAAPQSKYAL
mmetsp:Transcript_12156/g.29456  ORF Transcript_12156/g.29456 Transcript_12156/m.29456 type:complete len:219 (+) Transcript_12156:2085-2741(+)